MNLKNNFILHISIQDLTKLKKIINLFKIKFENRFGENFLTKDKNA